MNISQHCFIPICQYELGSFDTSVSVNGGSEISIIPSYSRRALYPTDGKDVRYNYFDFSGVNSILFLSTLAGTTRPFVGFPSTSYPFGKGVYIPYIEFADVNLLAGYTYTAPQGADLDSCKNMFISDNATDAEVRYVFWKELEPVVSLGQLSLGNSLTPSVIINEEEDI